MEWNWVKEQAQSAWEIPHVAVQCHSGQQIDTEQYVHKYIAIAINKFCRINFILLFLLLDYESAYKKCTFNMQLTG